MNSTQIKLAIVKSLRKLGLPMPRSIGKWDWDQLTAYHKLCIYMERARRNNVTLR